MIILGIVLIVIGWFTWRPLVYAGAVLALIGLVLLVSHAGTGSYGYY
jgi:hypothetical protein